MPENKVASEGGGGKVALVLVDANAVAAARDWLFRLCDADDPDECYSVAMVVEALEKATAAPDYDGMVAALRRVLHAARDTLGFLEAVRAALALAEGDEG